MARTYAKLIANLITGPIIVGGWSFGGVAAYEVARHLELLGRITQGILLINAPNPVRHVPLSDSIINTVLHLQVVALNSAQYGQGFPGPNCFKKITMTYQGKKTTATIVDKCPGCPVGGLDLSVGLFTFFAPESQGVIFGEWNFAA
ncbi:hypothetical protein J132_07362 [Termitomyces sp. J132]|nr:hypothetical protein J132_07362 [Termitomyces sp. J132]